MKNLQPGKLYKLVGKGSRIGGEMFSHRFGEGMNSKMMITYLDLAREPVVLVLKIKSMCVQILWKDRTGWINEGFGIEFVELG